jgi:hypothetical protein
MPAHRPTRLDRTEHGGLHSLLALRFDARCRWPSRIAGKMDRCAGIRRPFDRLHNLQRPQTFPPRNDRSLPSRYHPAKLANVCVQRVLLVHSGRYAVDRFPPQLRCDGFDQTLPRNNYDQTGMEGSPLQGVVQTLPVRFFTWNYNRKKWSPSLEDGKRGVVQTIPLGF